MLFDPIRLRETVLKNRVVIPPMVITDSDEQGLMTPHGLEHYRRMGHSGAGMVIQEATCVSDHAKLCENEYGLWQDDQIDGMHRVTDAIHEGGAVAMVQLHHAGVLSFGTRIEAPYDFDMELWGRRVAGRAMTMQDAQRIRDEFIAAGRRAMKAGYDGVELHGAHGYLLSEIMNRHVNQMAGIVHDDPCAYVRSILDGIRQETNDKFIIGIRLGGVEPTLADGIANVLALRGHVDYFHVSHGHSSSTPVDQADMQNFPYQSTVYMAMKVKQALMAKQDTTPVIAVTGLSEPGVAERMLQETQVDLAAVGRGHLVNDQWTNDLMQGLYPGRCYQCKACRVRAGICPGQTKLRNKRKNQQR